MKDCLHVVFDAFSLMNVTSLCKYEEVEEQLHRIGFVSLFCSLIHLCIVVLRDFM